MIMVSNAEIEKLFGWKKGKAGVYASRNVLPEPVQVLSCGKLWSLNDILYTANERGWAVDQEALREIHKSVTQNTAETRDALNAEINSMKNMLRNLNAEIEKKQRLNQDLEQDVLQKERESEIHRARLVHFKNEITELEVKLERLREEEKRINEWITRTK